MPPVSPYSIQCPFYRPSIFAKAYPSYLECYFFQIKPLHPLLFFFFFNDPPPPEISPLPLPDALPIPTVTREPFRNQGRISNQITAGPSPQNIGLPELNPETDRVMLCGTPAMLNELKELLEHRSEEHTSELQSQSNLVCRLLLEKKK